MPTAFHLPLELLLWVGVGVLTLSWVLAIRGLTSARHRLQELRSRQQTQRNEVAKLQTLLDQRNVEYSANVSELRRDLDLKTEHVADLQFQLAAAKRPPLVPELRQPLPRLPQAILPDAAENQSEAKILQLEENLTQARRSREVSEQSLRKLKLSNQDRERKFSELLMQIDDTARNLEETHILLAEKQRELSDLVRRLQASEGQVAELQGLVSRPQIQLQETLTQLRAQRDTNAALEQLLREAQDTIGAKEVALQESTGLYEAVLQQLEGKQTAYATLERMLQDVSSVEILLRRELKAMTLGREQLEIQNIDLKRIVDQLTGRATQMSLGDTAALSSGQAPVVVEEINTQWAAVTEGDIHEAVLQLAPMSSQAPPDLESMRTFKPNRAPLVEAAAVEYAPPVEVAAVEKELRQARLRLQVLESNMGDSRIPP